MPAATEMKVLNMKTRDLTSHFGAEVLDIDLSRELSSEDKQELRKLLYEKRLLYFGGQHLTPEQQVAVMDAIGNVISETPDRAKVSAVSAKGGYIKDTGRLLFHSDYQFTEEGALHAISLYATEMEAEEPTVFANMVRAVEQLPSDLASKARSLDVVQLRDYSVNHSESKRARLSERIPGAPDGQYPHSIHPMVRKHPVTGEDVLNVSQLNTSHVAGQDDATSETVFKSLEPYQYGDENCYVHNWKLNDILIWDNIALQHGRGPVTDDRPRTLQRVAVNPHDVPTMLRNARPDPVRYPNLQWWAQDEPIASAQ
jgi:taurine dioxygenase